MLPESRDIGRGLDVYCSPMGILVDGTWHTDMVGATSKTGAFERKPVTFRERIEPAATASEGTRFVAESGRYHLYVSLACPWAHRTLILRALKGLEDVVSVSVVDPLMLDQGWVFSDGPGCVPDSLFGSSALHQIYTRAMPDYSGRVTVPVLWDKRHGTIVNNESSEIVRMFNVAFDALATKELPDLYPETLRADIDALNARIYDTLNNGVYRSGFATTQSAYETAVTELFATLDMLEARLEKGPYLFGERMTEADWRLFPTLVRFDAVYHGHFKCNLRKIMEYPNLWAYTKRLYHVPGVAPTVSIDHIKRHYYGSHLHLNPKGIVPVGPVLSFD